MTTAFSSLSNIFNSEIRAELEKYPITEIGTITEKNIIHLPEPVQRYLKHCGYLNKMQVLNAMVYWDEVYLKTNPKKDWMAIDCLQFNSVAEPTRIVYMKARLFNAIDFEGRDKCQEGKGNMLIRLMKYLTLANAKGKEMDASALVTVLAESILVPGYIFQSYISWNVIDENSCRGTLKFKGTEVSGLFFFDDAGECIRFVTNDRYFAGRKQDYKKVTWTVTFGNYREKKGIRFPGFLTATWNMDEGDFQYFKGNVESLDFNIRQA